LPVAVAPASTISGGSVSGDDIWLVGATDETST
jgi:hypothetical protein